MPLVEDGVTYLTATEASKELGLSRQAFYQTIKPMVHTHTISKRKVPLYREDEIKTLKEVQRIDNLPIVVSGITKNFEEYLMSLGYEVTIEFLGSAGIFQMDEQIATLFKMPVGSPVVKRKRRLGVRGIPYRIETTYYPVNLTDSNILELMRENPSLDVLDLIATMHHATITRSHEILCARLPTQAERRELGIRATDPIIEVNRTGVDEVGNTVITFQELLYVAGYFKLEYEYPVAHWESNKSA